MRGVLYVETRMMTVEGHFTETLFKLITTAMFIHKTNAVCLYMDAPVLCRYN